MRFVFGYVYRELHELLDRGFGFVVGGQWFAVGNAFGSQRIVLEAARLIVDITKRYYEQNDETVLPRSIATKQAFENAMSLDVAMGGSTNTVLHLLAAAREAEVDFKMADIDRISRQVPCLCKVAPNSKDYYMEDVHRAGGVMAILNELAKAGKLHTDVYNVHSGSLKMLWQNGTCPTLKMPLPFNALKPPLLAFASVEALPNHANGKPLIWIDKMAVSAAWNTLIRKMAVWRCCLATLPNAVAWSKQQAWTKAFGDSQVVRVCLKAKIQPLPRFWTTKLWQATS